MNTVTTAFGDVPIDALVKRYEAEKRRDAKKYERRLAFLQTDEGIEWNRQKAKSYYERNREEILLKRRAYYIAKKQAAEQAAFNNLPPENPEFV